jgi:hypothetical protein
MELTHLNQINFDELRFEKIDCLIAACGPQPRCYHLAEKVHSLIPKKILLTTDESDRKQNGSKYLPVFSDYGFQHYITAENESKVIDKLLLDLCNVRAHQLNIMIDYSCMAKKWYALIIDNVTRNSYKASRINLFFSYTPKIFERKSGKNAIDYVGPILFNRDNLKDRKPVSMIASLDNSPDSIMEAISKVKPQKLFAFIPRCPHDPDYTQLVLENNKALLERLDSNSIVSYDADRPEEINTLLTSYCLDQRIASEVIIVPQGPKTFSMMSLLLSVRYPDVKLWEIILKDQKIISGQGLPAADPVIVKVSFINDEDETDQ